MFNIANNLTLARILAIPVLVLLMYYPTKLTSLLAMLFFILASLTDLFDGFLARKYNIVTSLGKFLDPLADKLLVISALIMLVHSGWLQAWIVIIIVGRETMVTGLRAIAAERGQVISADKYGKLKTILQVVAICPLILHYTWWGFDPNPIGNFLILIALILTVFSGGNYMYRFFSQVSPASGSADK
ncbi:MAG: CDP-diacylglycerol--glycerol-3-phosphate 3-phosphatidyltransferase [Desulfohalobiaceae bacterium]|nr:CDP-diacylglycerol--glycerol-3-phosphate 3-phosphatidyltransferase [Desulfohalobiaceae bacterium]